MARSGETSRQSQWRDELLKAGIRGKGGQKLRLLDLEPLPGARYIHAVGTVAETNERVAVSFGPEHAALEQRQVEIAKREAGDLFPCPSCWCSAPSPSTRRPQRHRRSARHHGTSRCR